MNHRGIWLTATVLAVIVLLAQIAGASTRDETTSLATSASVSVSADLTGTAARASLPEQASSVASVASEKSANADEAITTRGRTTETAQNEVTVSARSEEHTSELQSRGHLVCRLLLEKKKKKKQKRNKQKKKKKYTNRNTARKKTHRQTEYSTKRCLDRSHQKTTLY